MVLGIVLMLVLGGVILLRPITKRLGAYLEVLAEERRRSVPTGQVADVQRIASTLEAMDRRLAALEERQEFTDALLGDRDREERRLR
jgi:hypothetical protein